MGAFRGPDPAREAIVQRQNAARDGLEGDEDDLPRLPSDGRRRDHAALQSLPAGPDRQQGPCTDRPRQDRAGRRTARITWFQRVMRPTAPGRQRGRLAEKFSS
jgi:hypothetical protein